MQAKALAIEQLTKLSKTVADLEKRRRSKGGEHSFKRYSPTLAKVIEEGLMHYYLEKKGYTEPEELYDDAFYSDGVFGRMQSWQEYNVVEMFKDALQYDLDSNLLFCKVQEFFLSREIDTNKANRRQEALFNYLPKKPMDDHITNCIEFFGLLP